jgi:hypothetical protein
MYINVVNLSTLEDYMFPVQRNEVQRNPEMMARHAVVMANLHREPKAAKTGLIDELYQRVEKGSRTVILGDWCALIPTNLAQQ